MGRRQAKALEAGGGRRKPEIEASSPPPPLGLGSRALQKGQNATELDLDLVTSLYGKLGMLQDRFVSAAVCLFVFFK